MDSLYTAYRKPALPNYKPSKKEIKLMSASLKIGLKVCPSVHQYNWTVMDGDKKRNRTKKLLRLHVVYKRQILYLTQDLQDHELTKAVIEAYKEYYTKIYKYKSIYTRRFVTFNHVPF